MQSYVSGPVAAKRNRVTQLWTILNLCACPALYESQTVGPYSSMGRTRVSYALLGLHGNHVSDIDIISKKVESRVELSSCGYPSIGHVILLHPYILRHLHVSTGGHVRVGMINGFFLLMIGLLVTWPLTGRRVIIQVFSRSFSLSRSSWSILLWELLFIG